MEENTSNEQQQEVCTEKKCKCKAIKCILTLLILGASLTSMVFSILINHKLNIFFKAIKLDTQQVMQEAENDFLISEKFDKGQSLEKAQKENKPILTFFYVDWCGYCKRFAPIFAKIQKDKEIKDNFASAFVNCEAPENQAIVEKYQIQGFPSVFVVKGEEKEQIGNDILYGEYNDLKKVILEKK